jgi:hypothetical protein
LNETNVVNAQKKMLERKQQKIWNQHVLKEYKKDGEERYFIMKKKDLSTIPAAEEIFTDWKANLDGTSFEQRRAAALLTRTNQKRKLSHRALRKELVKEILENESKAGNAGLQKSYSYADMVKRNMTAPIEDIFEAWRDYLQVQYIIRTISLKKPF